MATRRKHQRIKADEVFDAGIFSIARFGKDLIWKSRLTKESHPQYIEHLIELYPKVVTDIDQLVSAIAEQVGLLPPEKLLHRAWGEMAVRHLKIESEVEVSNDDATSMRMIDYIQSIIASTVPSENQKREISEEDWKALSANVDKLFHVLNLNYQICRSAKAKHEDPDYNEHFDEFFFKAQLYWCNVRGSRYQVHEEIYLRDVIIPHSAVFEELFGITSDIFIQELMKIWNALIFGIQQTFDEMDSLRKDSLAAAETKLAQGLGDSYADFGELLNAVIVENGWEKRREKVGRQFLGTDLFDVKVQTSLPELLLSELTWAQGQDQEFFALGQFKGWPLRIWPTFKRPFIRLEERIYCFDLHGLFDNIYRIMQRAILRLKPAYGQVWNKTQQTLSEDLPFKYLKAILPDSPVFRSVHYRWFAETAHTTKNWCEADGILIHDDHLFIIESRGGSFTYTPPATDFPAFVASLKNLVLKPASQGNRFLQYLLSEESVAIFDGEHNQIAELKKSDFRHITICPVTLDPFTEMAAQVQHLRKIGVSLGAHPTWATSIDDLRVYSDIFDNPLQFLHYVEQRNEAYKSEILQLDDELDHLGLYLAHNHYSTYATEKAGGSKSRLNFLGYRSEIDKFFLERLHDANYPCPLKQQAPARFIEIVDFLAKSKRAGRSRIASYLLDMAGDERERFAECINKELSEQPSRGRPLAYSSAGGNIVGFTVFCYASPRVIRDANVAIAHTKQTLVLSNQTKRLLLELSYAQSGELSDIDWTWIDVASILKEEMMALKPKADTLRQSRLKQARAPTGK